MDLPQDLLVHLERLVESVGIDATSVGDPLVGLVTDLQDAVSGYAGLEVTVVQAGHPVTLTAVIPGTVEASVTSLGVPLPLLSHRYQTGGRAVFYSATHGAFVDLAADLWHGLSRGRPTVGLQPELDVDLPPPRTTSGISGLSELALIHQATGVLIEKGHDPDGVLDVLQAQAVAAGVAVHVVAAGLLAS